MADENKVIDFQSVEDVPVGTTIDTADGNTANTGNVAGITSPSINATSSVFNIPPSGGADFSGWSTGIVWTASDYNTVTWTSGDIKLASGASYSINAGNTGNITTVTYIYADVGTPSATLLTTTVPATAVGAGKLMVCVASPSTDTTTLAKFQAFGTVGTGVFITADVIASKAITTNELAANAIDGMTITGATVRTSSGYPRSQLDTSVFRSYDSGGVERVRIGSLGSTIELCAPTTGNLVGAFYGGSTGSTWSGPGTHSIIVMTQDVIGLLAYDTVTIGTKMMIPVGTNLY